MRRRGLLLGLALSALPLSAGLCSGGGGGGGGKRGGGGAPGVPASVRCDGSCPQRSLSVAQVDTVVAQAVLQAQSLGEAATIAVVDRLGNVLAVFQMPGARPNVTVTSQRGVRTGLDDFPFAVPSTLAAISKAGTAAFLSSQGNAFTTRTANQIVQENFNPGERRRPGGPLFGVQFSQLPCGDFVQRFDRDALRGPKRMPLGLAADPGGLPLYIDGVPVGGIGVELDGFYGLDRDVTDVDASPEERIASAGTRGFEAPEDRRADRIAVDGKLLRFADDERVAPTGAPPLAALAGQLVPVPRFFGAFQADGITPSGPATLEPGVELGTNASGVVATSFEGEPAEVLVDGGGAQRFAPRDSTDPLPPTGLAEAEVRVLLREALRVAARARAQIRRPPGSAARVNIAVVDRAGVVLGFVRSPDAPVFGMDVSLQKARTAAFFSSPGAAADLQAGLDLLGGLVPPGRSKPIARPLAQYVSDLRDFLGDATALANGVAFSDRAGGNLSRPFFPDGINGNPNGPLSRPFEDWSPFSTGLQLDLSLPMLAVFLCPLLDDSFRTFLRDLDPIFAGIDPTDPTSCPPEPDSCRQLDFGTPDALSELGNGIQIFPGSVPIYRGGTRIGGIGISGDGVDQDDLVAFLGVHNAGVALGGAIGNAPPAIRADTIQVRGVRLRYVNCPPSPFLGSTAQNVCEGK